MRIKELFSLKLILFVFLLGNNLYSQHSVGSKADQEMRTLVNLPTAGLLKGGNAALEIEILPQGLLLTKLEIAVTNFFSLGLSYGAANFIGTGQVEFNDLPGFHAKLKFFNETRIIPSFAIGFNSQGKGLFLDSLERYEIKSSGIYLAFTKNYRFLGYMSFHGQINYSLETKDGDENINFGFGIEKTIGSFLSFVAEYDLALNDDSKNSTGKGNGYLNIGLRWSISKNLTLGFNYINLLNNIKSVNEKDAYRSLFLDYSTNLY